MIGALRAWWQRWRYRRRVRLLRASAALAQNKWARNVAAIDLDAEWVNRRRRAGYGRQWWS